MRTTSAVAVLAAALLVGCAGPRHDRVQHLSELLHERPIVTERGGIVSVAPEPVVLYRGEGRISWQLPAGLTFADNGIEIEGLVLDAKGQPAAPVQGTLEARGLKVDREQRRAFACAASGKDRREFTCQRQSGARSGVYKYTIRVLRDGRPLPAWDPHIFSME